MSLGNNMKKPPTIIWWSRGCTGAQSEALNRDVSVDLCVLWRITIPSYGSVFEAIQTVIKSRQFFYGPLHPRIWTHKHQSTYKVVVCPHDEQEKPHEKNNKKKRRGGSSRFYNFYYFMKNSSAGRARKRGTSR